MCVCVFCQYIKLTDFIRLELCLMYLLYSLEYRAAHSMYISVFHLNLAHVWWPEWLCLFIKCRCDCLSAVEKCWIMRRLFTNGQFSLLPVIMIQVCWSLEQNLVVAKLLLFKINYESLVMTSTFMRLLELIDKLD